MNDKPRSLSQNNCLWAALSDIANQIEWCVNGRMQKITAEDFKHILSSALFKEHRLAEGIDGGFVLLGQRTSKLTKVQFSELLELVYAFGAERGVKFGVGHTYDDWRDLTQ